MCSIFITKGYSILEHKEMSKHISMRGLDTSLMAFDNLIITHRRLPLQESSTRQPIFTGKEYLWLIGEYYEDYLGDELMALHDQLKQENWFVDWEGTLFIYNEKDNILKIKVDPLRKRPIFYYQNTNQQKWIITNDFSFFKSAKNELFDMTNLALIQRNGFAYSNSTPFINVKSFLPGDHVVNIKTGEFGFLNLSSYNITVPFEMLNMKKAIGRTIKDMTINRIKKASLTMQFGVYLSGGVDSTLLLKIIDDNWSGCGQRIPAIILKNLCTNDELKNIEYLEKTTSIFNFHFHEFVEPILQQRIEDVIRWFYFPIDLGSVIPQIQLAIITKMYRNQYPELYAILTGDGADEFFGGYKRNRNYDSRYYDMFIELIYYHNLKLDQIAFKNTIEVRTPFQALPLIPYVLLMEYSDRINKKLFRELGTNFFGIPKKHMMIKKYPLKILPKTKTKYQRGLIHAFMEN